jgi:hypothetical protein
LLSKNFSTTTKPVDFGVLAQMQLSTFLNFALLFASRSHANGYSLNSSLEWVKNKWTIENPEFTRLGNESDLVSSTSVAFQIWYHKWEACNTSTRGSTTASPQQDPDLCGLDLDTSYLPARCSLYYDGQLGAPQGQWPKPYPKTLWRTCQGRWKLTIKEAESCKGTPYGQRLSGAGPCGYDSTHRAEDESERLWIKWRVIAFEEGLKLVNESKSSPWNSFKSITVEVVNGQM